MKIHRKYFEFSLFIIVVLSITFFAYSKMLEDQSSKTVNASIEKKTTSTNPEIKETSLIIETATATQEEQMISIDLKIKNKTESAQVLKPELFSLISNTTVLSPKEKSDIPKQIPAQTEAEFKLIFDVKNMEGTVPIKLGFQAIGSSEPQQFYPLGTINIKRIVSTRPTSSKPNSTTTKSPQTKLNTEITLHSQSIGPIQVLVPDGWIKSPHKGGDFGGFQFMNPKDRNQQMLVVYSACAGCGYLDADTSQSPDPVSLIFLKHLLTLLSLIMAWQLDTPIK